MTDERKITLERTYDASPDELWKLWTTPEGIEAWWSPDGFSVKVDTLDLKPGGELRYTMTATAPAQIEFMQSVGMPLSTESRKTFTEVVPVERLAYDSLVDFVPGVEPYWLGTVVELQPVAEGTRVVMTVDPMHDPEWTQRLTMGRENELDNLRSAIASGP